MIRLKNMLPQLLAIFSIISCAKQPCQMADAVAALVAFSADETDTVIVRRFSTGSNFTALKDTFLFNSTNANFQRMSDTTLVLANIDQRQIITSAYDYEIFIPKANRLFKISDIVEKIQTVSQGLDKVLCVNPITSYKIDGQLITPTIPYGNVYLNK